MNRIIYLLSLTVLTFCTIYARDPVKDSVLLDEQVVTGTRFVTNRTSVPFAISGINAPEIKHSGQFNILTSLSSHVPGFFVTERNILGFGVAANGSGSISIRGIGSAPNTQVLVLIDGHPQFQGIFGHPLADAYVASDVEKVEVIRGPASVLYGSNAMAGAINIITRKAAKEGFGAEATAVVGSYNTQKYAVTANYRAKKFHTFVAANYGSTDGIRENTDFNIANGYVKTGYDFNANWSAVADLSLADYKANDNGSIYSPPAPFHIDILRGKTALSIDNKYDKTEGSLKLYHNFGHHDLSDGWISDDRNSGLMAYQTFEPTEYTKLTGGVEAKQYGGITNKGVSSNQLKTVTELAVYTLLQQRFLNMFTFTGGLRLEQNSIFGSEWVPMAGVSSAIRSGTTLRFSASKGFRSPTIMELYTYFPNPELQPERMMNYEFSWIQSLFNHLLTTELTLFSAAGENLIQVTGVGENRKRENVGTFSTSGIELSVRYRASKSLIVNGNYSFLSTDKVLLAAPRHQANLTASYQYGIFNLNVSVRYINGLYTGLQIPETESYTLLNARLAAGLFPRTEFFVMGQNLLNQAYQLNYGYPMPGITVHGGVIYKL